MENPARPTTQAYPWRALAGSYAFVCYFSLVFVALTACSGLTGLSVVKYVLLYSLVWLLPPLWLPSLARGWLWAVGLVCWLGSLLKLGYFAIYRQEMSQSVFFTLFESNASESSEYLVNYAQWWMLPALLLYSLAAIVLARAVRPFSLARKWRVILTAIVALSFLEPVLTNWKGFNMATVEAAARRIATRHNGIEPWQTVISYYRYRNEVAQMQRLLQAMQQASQQPLAQRDAHAQQTFVLVIGESTNRQRMSLYGYQRQTTPQLDALRSQLAVFDDVIAARPYTIESLRQAFSLADSERPELEFSKPNVISLMRRAGFKTFWITNQQTISDRNTLLTAYSQLAAERTYLNNNRVQSSSQYDEVVLAPYARALADPASKKFIVVHLLGTHIGYHHRFPSEFARFTDKRADSVLDESEQQMFNDYDNAVLYNDAIVAQLIAIYRRHTPYGALVYFSDHGEEVFDFRRFQGRDEANPSPPMYTIPFLVLPSESWLDENRQRAEQMRAVVHRPFSLANFAHGWCDLVTIDSPDCIPERSVFSARFVATPRLVGDPARPSTLRDYDRQVAALAGGEAHPLFAGSVPDHRQPPAASRSAMTIAAAGKPHQIH